MLSRPHRCLCHGHVSACHRAIEVMLQALLHNLGHRQCQVVLASGNLGPLAIELAAHQDSKQKTSKRGLGRHCALNSWSSWSPPGCLSLANSVFFECFQGPHGHAM